MVTVEKYSLGLVFFALIGIGHGLGRAYFDAERTDKKIPHKGWYLLGAGISLVYGFLGLGIFGGGHEIYIYLPVLLLWWGGTVLGTHVFPVPDRAVGLPITVGLGTAVILFHTVL